MRSRSACILCAILFLFSCDTLIEADDPLFLLIEFDEICFEVNSISQGGTVTISAENALDIGPALDRENFAKGDVVGAEVVFANLRLVFPVESSLNIIRDVSLSVGGTQAVATSSSFSATRSAELSLTGANVGGTVRGASFQPTLRFTGASSVGERVVIEGAIRIQVEVSEL